MRLKVFFTFIVVALIVSTPQGVDARRRNSQVNGILNAPKSKGQCTTPETAYWSFGVPNLPHPPCRPIYWSYIITLDHWNEGDARKLRGDSRENPTVTIKGVDFNPKIIAIPKESQSYEVTIRNTDRFKHEIYSPEVKKLGTEVIESSVSSTMRFASLPSLAKGEVYYVPLRCKLFDHMRGGVAFVHSTAYAIVGPRGRFSISRVPHGKYTLRVWKKDKKIHEKEITVGRRGVSLKLNLIEEKKKKAENAETVKESTKENNKTDKRTSRRRRKRRRRRRRSR